MKFAVDNIEKNSRQLSGLVEIDSPAAVIEEVTYILSLTCPEYDCLPVTSAFQTTLDLFAGNYPGYRACNTEYHDFAHTNSVFLAVARLIHGAVVDGERLSPHQIALGLMAALFHDAGYIQKAEDTTGTGAKYTTSHVERSMDLFEYYGRNAALSDNDIRIVQTIILCTNLSIDIATIRFPCDRTGLLGKILGAADVLAQMADRAYLEKLLFLYHEIRESGIGGYCSEVDLLRKTIGFYDFISNRLDSSLDGVHRFMRSHFLARWDMDANLYLSAIEKQKNYLRSILSATDADPRDFLKREGIVDRVHKKYGRQAAG